MSLNLNTLSKRLLSIKTPIYILIGVWFTSLLVLRLCQYFHLVLGFHVWALGEDRNWIELMMKYPGTKMIPAFWNINDRNPLSPWWWYSIKTLVDRSEYWLYFVRQCISLFLAVTTFLVLDRLGKRQCRTFAFSVALVVLFWDFSAYFEQITWNFLGALGFSLLSVFFYCRYLDNKRQTGHDLGFAMLCYFFAIATYTLQSGAVITIAFLAFFWDTNKQTFFQRCINTIRDTSLFVAIFALYEGIWITTSRNNNTFYVFHWDLFYKQIFISIQKLLFHPTYEMLLNNLMADWSLLTIFSISIVAFLTFSFILFKNPAKQMLDNKILIPVGAVFSLLLTIASPVVILEATSQIWIPGTRSPMIQQVWQPLLYVSFIFIAMNLMPLNEKMKYKLTLILVSLLASAVFVMGLDYNHHLNLRTAYLKNLMTGIHNLHINQQQFPYLLVELTDKQNQDKACLPLAIPNYSKTILPEKMLSVRPLMFDFKQAKDSYEVVAFNSDAEGVTNAGSYGDTSNKPYKNTLIIFFDGKNVWIPKKVEKHDFDGLEVAWNRDQPIFQTLKT